MKEHLIFLREAVKPGREGMNSHSGGPFGAVIVKEGKIIARGCNRVVPGNDPTAHAEINAIRNACHKLGSWQLRGCVLYTSCEPCPMCLGAIYRARIHEVIYACDRKDAAAAGFDDDFLYSEMKKEMKERALPL